MQEKLAIQGGPSAFPEGAPSWPAIDDETRQSILAAMDNGTWGQYEGPHCQALIDAIAVMHQVDQVLLCCSGTFAVELALRGLKVAPGDEVVLAGYDFPGNFRAIEAMGARPVLVDIDPGTWCLDAAHLGAAVGPKTTAVIVSHLHGGLARMSEIRELADRHHLRVVEDVCQAPGAVVDGRVAGTWGDVGVWSFGGSKLLTAGRGGAIYTSQADVLQRARIFCERGNQAFPLSEIQAALLVPPMKMLARRNTVRNENVQRLRNQLEDVAAFRMVTAARNADLACFYKVGLQLQPSALKDRSREDLVAAFQAEGIAIDVGFRGFARRSTRRCRQVGELDHSKTAAAHTLLLHHPILLQAPAVIDRLAEGIRKVTNGLGL